MKVAYENLRINLAAININTKIEGTSEISRVVLVNINTRGELMFSTYQYVSS